MNRIREAVEIYLSHIGQKQAPELGGRPNKDSGRDELREHLLQEQHFNRRIFSLIVFLLTFLFALGAYFVLKNRNQPLNAGAFLSGEFVSFLLVIQWIRQTLLDKVYTDLLVRASDELDPEHLAKFVTTFYELTSKAHPLAENRPRRSNVQRARATRHNG
jgi:hypothetical protein